MQKRYLIIPLWQSILMESGDKFSVTKMTKHLDSSKYIVYNTVKELFLRGLLYRHPEGGRSVFYSVTVIGEGMRTSLINVYKDFGIVKERPSGGNRRWSIK